MIYCGTEEGMSSKRYLQVRLGKDKDGLQCEGPTHSVGTNNVPYLQLFNQ